MKQYPKDQLWNVYEKLPDNLKDAIFAVESAESIDLACRKTAISDDKKVSKIARLTSRVLLGILAPDEFQKNLEKEVDLNPKTAKKLFFEINRLIFSRVRKSLDLLHETEVPENKEEDKKTKKSKVSRKSLKKSLTGKPPKKKKQDKYRENF